MKHVKPTQYLPVELEIITLDNADILTTSVGGSGDIDSDGYVSDGNVDDAW